MTTSANSQQDSDDLHRALLPDGFIVPGDNVQTIVDNDAKTLAALGVTHDQVADALESLLDRRCSAIDEQCQQGLLGVDIASGRLPPVWVTGKLQVDQDSYMGSQKCPFPGCPDAPSGCDTDVTVVRHDEVGGGGNSMSFTFSTLLPHLIRRHHFFESPRVSHRLDPAAVVSALDLVAGGDYRNDGRWRKYKSGMYPGFFDKDGNYNWLPRQRESNIYRVNVGMGALQYSN
jgi:hypothetical protein